MLKNGISERLDFEIFWGSMHPPPPLGYQKSLDRALQRERVPSPLLRMIK